VSSWIFVRHGQSLANAERWYSGHCDVPLTATGRSAAVALGAALSGEDVQRALSSDLRRAVMTATLILGERPVPLMVSPALRERDVGEWTGRTLDDIPTDERERFMHGWSTTPPKGESLEAVVRRAVRWLGELPPVPGVTLVVAHGGTLRGLLGLVDGNVGEGAARRVLDNTVPERRTVPAGFWVEQARLLGVDGV
jgi:broad specificity phosphatase PhoE